MSDHTVGNIIEMNVSATSIQRYTARRSSKVSSGQPPKIEQHALNTVVISRHGHVKDSSSAPRF
ncbi:hypothetical protein EON65_03095 [archaeon]|nr:MAG: hypothetical protein EON65_03095 [archaeon]